MLELALGAEEPRRTPYPFTVTQKGKTVTRHGEQWTFRIQRGLRFQDDLCFRGGRGREIIAADFLYSFRRIADLAVPCPVLSFFEAKIVGSAEYVAHNRNRSRSGEDCLHRHPRGGHRLEPLPARNRTSGA